MSMEINNTFWVKIRIWKFLSKRSIIIPVAKEQFDKLSQKTISMGVWKFFCKFRSSMIMMWGWRQFSAFQPCLTISTNLLACQGHPLKRVFILTLIMTADLGYSGILPSYTMDNSPYTFPQFLVGIVHFLVAS